MLVLLRGPHLMEGKGGFGRNLRGWSEVAGGAKFRRYRGRSFALRRSGRRSYAVRRDPEQIIRHPAIVESVGKYAGTPRLAISITSVSASSHHSLMANRVERVVIRAGAGGNV